MEVSPLRTSCLRRRPLLLTLQAALPLSLILLAMNHPWMNYLLIAFFFAASDYFGCVDSEGSYLNVFFD